jgi:hypothetical protein
MPVGVGDAGRQPRRGAVARHLIETAGPAAAAVPVCFSVWHLPGERMWVVAQDTLYTDKLLRQRWFRTGYPAIAQG